MDEPDWQVLELEFLFQEADRFAAKYAALWFLYEALYCPAAGVKDEEEAEEDEDTEGSREHFRGMLEEKVDSFLHRPPLLAEVSELRILIWELD